MVDEHVQNSITPDYTLQYCGTVNDQPYLYAFLPKRVFNLTCSRLGNHSISQILSQNGIWKSLYVADQRDSCCVHRVQPDSVEIGSTGNGHLRRLRCSCRSLDWFVVLHVHERFETNQNIRHIGWVMLNCSNSQMASNGSVVHTHLVRSAWKTQWKTVINDQVNDSIYLVSSSFLLRSTQSRSYDRDRTPPFSSPLPTILFASEPYQSKYQSALTTYLTRRGHQGRGQCHPFIFGPERAGNGFPFQFRRRQCVSRRLGPFSQTAASKTRRIDAIPFLTLHSG